MIAANAINLALLCNMNPEKQEDAQEFLLRLFEKLGDDLGYENPTSIFAGEMTQYIRCKNVDIFKERKERFFDISVDISDNRDVQEALDEFFAPVVLEGDNQYKTEVYGFQDALKGQSICRLPKVLFIHLKRFKYDIITGSMQKFSKAVKFPMKLSLDRYLDFGTAVDNPGSKYELNAVILHNGNGDSGHYTCFARTCGSKDCDTWYRLDDNTFCEVDIDTVMMESVGTDSEDFKRLNGVSKNAYVLQYVINDDPCTLKP